MAAQPKLLEIAARIDEVLVLEIGQGIDCARLIGEPRYARDVLLVCEACHGTELPLLGRELRRLLSQQADPAACGAPGGHAKQPTAWSNTSTGFGVSRPLDSRQAADSRAPSTLTALEPDTRRHRHWLARWLKP